MNTSEGQRERIQVWAEGTTFVYDSEKQPKAEFARLAKVKGWVGGDAVWRMHWEACFGEPYPYGGYLPATTTMTQIECASGTSSPRHLADRMRRLSLSSDASSFSLISAGSSEVSLQSLNTNGSIAGGVTLPTSLEPKSSKSKKSSKIKPTPPIINDTSSNTTSQHNAQRSQLTSHTPAAKPATTKCSPFWYQFEGFEPAPTAPFKDEFARLAKHQGWGTKTKRKYQVEALTAEIAFHCGTCLTKLDRWQELCEEMGVDEVPTSITKCKQALQTVFVNLFNLIDHRRNSEVKIVHFKSHSEFCRHIRAGNKFPRQCAKQDGFISVLLKRI